MGFFSLGLTQAQKSSATTASVAGLIVAVGAIALEPVLSSSKLMTIVGGLACSLIFFFALLTIGNLQSETKWPEGLRRFFCVVLVVRQL
jgi:hypothetical protein